MHPTPTADRRTSVGPRAAGRSGARTALEHALFALLWLPYAALAWRFWFVTDDSYISFRFARNLARGHGLRYNLGDGAPVEGYSNFLWTALAALVEWLGGEPAFWMPLVSFACGTALLWLVWRVLVGRFELPLAVAFLATLSLGCLPPFAVWSTGGLATMPFALALFATFERLVLRRAGPHGAAAGAVGLVLALLRVEGVAWAAVLVPLTVLSRSLERRPFVRELVRYAAIVGLGYGAYWVARYAYYGLPLPNTAYAKVGLSLGVIETGLDYVVVYLLTFLAPMLVVPGWLAALRRRWRAPGLSVAAVSFGTLLYPVLVGGDFMAMGRFFVNGLAFGALLLAWLLATLWERGAAGRAGAGLLAAAGLVLGALPAWNVDVVPRDVRRGFHFRHNVSAERHLSEYEQWRYMEENTRRWRIKGEALRELAPEGGSVVAGAIGCVGYFSELFVWDKAGLVNHEVALGEGAAPDEKSPGHLKGVPNVYFLDRDPTFLDAKFFAGSGLRRDVEKQAVVWRRWPGHDRYVPDFLARGPAGEVPQHVVLVLRRLPEGADPEAAWQAFERRVAEYDWGSIGA